MKTLSIAAIAAIAVTLGLTAAARADITVVDNHQTVEVDCAKDPEVNLVGNHIALTTKGVCTKISITGNHETVNGSATGVSVLGNHNTINLAAADKVTVAGNYNNVTVRKAVSLKAPRISNVGNHNQVTQK
jgi:hypothetical protein